MTVRSTTATRLRAFAAAMAPFWPAGPLPITTRSYADALTLTSSNPQCQQEHWFSLLTGSKVHFCFCGLLRPLRCACCARPDSTVSIVLAYRAGMARFEPPKSASTAKFTPITLRLRHGRLGTLVLPHQAEQMAAVGDELRAGREAGLAGGDEQHHARELVRLAHARNRQTPCVRR